MIYLVRYAEIALKGKNRNDFENKLVENLRVCAQNSGFEIKINKIQGRFLAVCDKEIDFRKVFGIVSFSPCTRTELELEAICSKALQIAEKHPETTTFRISAKKLSKGFGLSSMELNSKVGAFIANKTGFKVKLDNPDLDLGIELIGKEAFVFDKTIACFGGLPVGIEGKVLVLLSDEKSLLAALLMMKRGCAIEIVGFSEVSVQEISLLQAFCPYKLVFNKVNDASDFDKLASSLGCKAFVAGDTIHDFSAYPINIITLRPLVAFSDSEIHAELDKFRKTHFESI